MFESCAFPFANSKAESMILCKTLLMVLGFPGVDFLMIPSNSLIVTLSLPLTL